MKNIKLYLTFIIISITALVFSVPIYAADSWPGDSGSVIANRDPSSLGVGYEPSGIVYQSRLNKLVLVWDNGYVTTMDTDGSNIDTDHKSGDFEGLAIVDQNSDYVYVGTENSNRIKSFNFSTKAFGEKEWNLDAWMVDPSGSNGLEALAFVPDGSHPYGDDNGDTRSGGLFYAGLQYDGDIYVFDIDVISSHVVSEDDFIGKITLDDSRTDISGLDYNTETGLLYAIFDSSNELLEIDPTDNTVLNTYTLPGINQEGISIISNCPDTSANAYVVEDSGDVKVYASYGITCLKENEDDSGDTDDSSDNNDDSTDDSSNSDSDDSSDSSSDDSSDETSTIPEDTTSRTTESGIIISPKIITTSGLGETTRVQIYDRKGNSTGNVITNLFPDSYLGGADVVSIDSNNNGIKDQALIYAINNGGPQARLIGIKSDKSVSNLGQQFVFDSSIRDGLSATSGDFDGDGYSDDAAFCLTGDVAPIVRIYTNVFGIDTWHLAHEFRAPFGNVGCNLGTFQYDNGYDDIIVTPNHGPAEPHVYIYWTNGALQKEFAAYPSGVQSGLTATGISERIYTTPNNGSSQINVFDKAGERKNFWWAYAEHIRGDYTNVAGDIDLDGIDELLVSPIGSNGPQVLAYEPSGKWRTWPNFFAFGDETLRNGVGIAVIDNYHGVN